MTSSSLNPKNCTNLRCYECDKKVQRFPNSKWKSHVDYLFVRNFATNPKELVKGLENEKGSVALACQCKWRTQKEKVQVD